MTLSLMLSGRVSQLMLPKKHERLLGTVIYGQEKKLGVNFWRVNQAELGKTQIFTF